MDREKKKFRWSKSKVKKCVNGSISVFLCLLLTPFLSVTLGLIEYARYQEVMEIADELMELTELFALADYDSYIHTRFGVLSVSQENALGDGLEAVLVENARITGNQLVPSNVLMSGKTGSTLKDTDILRQQLIDFSQLTSPAAILMEELKLEELLEKLNSLETFSNITNTVDQLATATGKVTKAVEALKTLKDDLGALRDAISATKNKATDFANKISNLLNDERLDLSSLNSPEGIQAAVQRFVDEGNGSGSLLTQIQDIYAEAKELKDSLDMIKTAANKVKTDAGTVRSSIQEAASAIRNIGDNDAEEDQSISGAMVTTVDSVVQEMEDLVNGTLTQIRDETIQSMENTANEIIDTILENTGLSDSVLNRYTEIVNGSYFKVDDDNLTISDNAKQDITDFLQMAYGVYNSARSGGGDVGSAIRDYFTGRFIPNISFDPTNLLNGIETVLNQAANSLQNQIQNAECDLGTLMEKLGNLARKIVSFSAFSDTRLNAVVSLGNPDANGAQNFVDAIQDLVNAIDDFKNSIGSFDLLGALTAIWDLLVAIKDMFVAIMKRVGNIIAGIAGLGGGFGAVYDRLIISEYMTHSLPCRTDATTKTVGGVVELEGKSLTGYSYNDIPRGSNTFDGAELEYVYAGTDSETGNQVFTFWDIYFLRLLLDMPAIFSNGEVSALAAAASVAAWVVYIIYILAEPFLDTLLLVNGTTVPLIKTQCWLTASGLGTFMTKIMNAITDCEDLKDAANDLVDSFTSNLQSGGGGAGGSAGYLEMSYKNYLLVMLTVLVETDIQVQRLGNLIDLEAAQYYQENGKSFDIAHTYTTLELSADMTFKPFVDVGVLSGNGPLNLSGHMTRTVSY